MEQSKRVRYTGEICLEYKITSSPKNEEEFKDYWKGEEKELEEINEKVFLWLEKHCISSENEEKNVRD